jgi:hypothetical protein
VSPTLRTLRFRGKCPCCGHHRVDLVRCECSHPTTSHRIDLKRQACGAADCTCRDYIEAPDQEDAA